MSATEIMAGLALWTVGAVAILAYLHYADRR